MLKPPCMVVRIHMLNHALFDVHTSLAQLWSTAYIRRIGGVAWFWPAISWQGAIPAGASGGLLPGGRCHYSLRKGPFSFTARCTVQVAIMLLLTPS
jgi:hypothetical protein